MSELWSQDRHKKYHEDHPMEIQGIEDCSLADLERLYEYHNRQYHYWRKVEWKPWGIIEDERAYAKAYKEEIKRRLSLKRLE
tara:strand:+ start:121 stop:366 length:246 start_codon:yes stop_codon:yes gene_type:complete